MRLVGLLDEGGVSPLTEMMATVHQDVHTVHTDDAHQHQTHGPHLDTHTHTALSTAEVLTSVG